MISTSEFWFVSEWIIILLPLILGIIAAEISIFVIERRSKQENFILTTIGIWCSALCVYLILLGFITLQPNYHCERAVLVKEKRVIAILPSAGLWLGRVDGIRAIEVRGWEVGYNWEFARSDSAKDNWIGLNIELKTVPTLQATVDGFATYGDGYLKLCHWFNGQVPEFFNAYKEELKKLDSPYSDEQQQRFLGWVKSYFTNPKDVHRIGPVPIKNGCITVENAEFSIGDASLSDESLHTAQ